MALLPEGDHYGVVWTMTPERAQQVLALADHAFLAALAARFGAPFEGFVGVSSRRSFPLALEVARPTVATRAVVIGNAAQSLHPVAGQGFNLGMRDAFELAQTIIATPRGALGGGPMLETYVRRRLPDRRERPILRELARAPLRCWDSAVASLGRGVESQDPREPLI